MVAPPPPGAKARIDAMLNAHASSIYEGIVGPHGPVCGATLPVVGPDGEPVRCQREPSHPLGPYDRHKCVGKTPTHYAVVWNEEMERAEGEAGAERAEGEADG